MELLKLDRPEACTIVERLNRFVVEVRVGGKLSLARITNTGRLRDYLVAGRVGYCLPNRGKTNYRLVAVEDLAGAALIDTDLQMKSFEAALRAGALRWAPCEIISRSPRVGSSRLDYLLRCRGTNKYVELKSAVLRDGDFAMYPDCPTLRGRRHISELIGLAEKGIKAMIVFVAALPGVRAFKPYREGDPEVSVLLGKAVELGVEVRAFSIHYDPDASVVVLDREELEVVI
ncbi:DNA/RNA nuclease SfsA [Infirmifilum lucidum]|uniref:DNA/RNA nuclease SfsA n=1 Tax=Infirmifilum lucidum TaxID=2776706 RepID=A0A7L9FG15_9CREN|nr:DNA/RNA nuclease SfsA [Infirmifilum lucidum]QOJ78637.1 DNA/RNA nuclease SfsA [Infirmifilum lucidum]